MAPTDNKPKVEREQTDQSLRAERDKSDEELLKSRTHVEEDADAVVQKSRERADAVLQTARDRADRRLEQAPADARVEPALRQERAAEDATLRAERRVADAQLELEREERRLFFATLLRDERAQTDQRLLLERARSDRESTSRDEFMGMVAHDLRTLLAGIAMSAELAAQHAPDDGEGQQVLRATDRIRGFTVRMNRLIGDLLDVASIEVGRLSVKPERHDSIRLVREAVEMFQPAASARGVALEARIVKDPLLARFDHDRILQVLGNLLSNALKFTNQGGSISLQVEQRGEEVWFLVRDTGVGVPPEKREAVFDRFWQATKDDRRGLGLGLFISRCIVEAHGGRIWVEGDPGQGSTFIFTLPAAAPGP